MQPLSRQRLRTLLGAAVSLLAVCAQARIVRVPQEAPTVQAGLDSLAGGDTVLVSRGLYAERLISPPFEFVMLGEYEPDSGATARPRVVSTGLGGADTQAVFTLVRFSRATIENMYFQNGPHPRVSYWRGIRSFADAVTLRNCVVDSTGDAFAQLQDSIGAVIVLDQCRLQADRRSCVFSRSNNVVHAADCVFRTDTLLPQLVSLVWAPRGSTFDRCQFRDSQGDGLLVVWGAGITVRDCIFGPGVSCQTGSVVYAWEFSGQFTDNLFVDCRPGVTTVDVSTESPDSVRITGNTFLRCQAIGPIGTGCGGVMLFTEDPAEGRGAEFANNQFIDCAGIAFADAVTILETPAQVRHNRFVGSGRAGRPAVQADIGWVPGRPVRLRDNLFLGTGYALACDDSTDARWNWWGDSSGPYHEFNNPEGQGDTLTGWGLFDPWYADTSSLAVRGVDLPLPAQFELNVYPNPFNAQVIFHLVPSRVQIVRVELFDLLGRRVAEVWTGPLGMEKKITFNASALSSGTYFARVTDTIEQQVVATSKLVLMK